MEAIYNENDSSLIVLDAGCGTGLAHSYLKPCAKKLVGMDISSKMLEKARSKMSYGQLLCNSLETGIKGYKTYFDLIICLDTLVYFGDLEQLFTVIGKAMSKNSYFIFTTEKHNGDQDYKLCYHGRYEHSSEYLKQMLLANDLDVVSLENCVTRKELGKDVEGWLITARRRT